MKKLLLFAFGAMVSMASFAQEEDVTHYIQNAGFDQDLTFQADGSMKEIVKKTEKIGRSYAWEAVDSTVYAHPDGTCDGKPRTDGLWESATNGFIGRVNGWIIETNQTYPKCEWVYFGTIPYALEEHAVPIADNGTTFLNVPEKPEAAHGDDNVGFAYLRAGWGGRAVYKQVVELPCAKYRLEYWAINLNPSGTNGKNLSKVTCRKDTWEDKTGFNDTEWTKHEIEFTPTAEFSMQFGFESEGGSGSNPFLCIDGIKLYKIGEADPVEVFTYDLNELQQEALNKKCTSLASFIEDYKMEIEDDLDEATPEAIEKVEKELLRLRSVIDAVDNLKAIVARMNRILGSVTFAGIDEFSKKIDTINGYLENDEYDDIVERILGAEEEGMSAIIAYYSTANASVDAPADFTGLIQHPWFIDYDAEPNADMEFPKRYVDDEDTYKDGSASSPDLNSAGWTVTGASGGDQRLNWKWERSCWNAWRSNFVETIAVGQTITNLPNGYYTVSADMITQSGYANETQRVYAESVAERKTSTQVLSYEGEEQWETIAMSTEDKVLVIDGKLTIGAQGTGDGNASAGWFCVTNFKLYYLGAAPEDAIKNALDAKVAKATAMAETMKFAVDRNALQTAVSTYQGSTEYVAAMDSLNVAMAEAQKSIDKYTEYDPGDEWEGDRQTKTLLYVFDTLKKNGGDGYGNAEDIVQFAYDWVQTWIACDTATYTKFDAAVDMLKNYLNDYTPVYNEMGDKVYNYSANLQKLLTDLMDAQKKELIRVMQPREIVLQFIDDLRERLALVVKQDAYESLADDATDLTQLIVNPNAEALNGWTFSMGNGDGNGEKSGQWFDGSEDTRYFDSYNGGGLKGFSLTQLLSIPNGTYNLGVYTRTPAEGAYIFYKADDNDTTFVEIPTNTATIQIEDTETGEIRDTIVGASDKYGPLWEEAKKAVEAGTADELQQAIYEANQDETGLGQGRGWQHQEMTGIEVKDHKLLIGSMCGTSESKTEKVFGGNWYSVGGWTLTLTAKGNNDGWIGPVSGINNVKSEQKLDGIYTITGMKAQKLQRGLNIIVRNGSVRKVLVK